MQKQSFEKQVQAKMEELSFVPSVPVWHKIEDQIKKKKERRRVAFWILFPLLIISAGIYGWYEMNLSNQLSEQKTEITDNKNLDNIIDSKSVNENNVTDNTIEESNRITSNSTINHNNKTEFKISSEKNKVITKNVMISSNSIESTASDFNNKNESSNPKEEKSDITGKENPTQKEDQSQAEINKDIKEKVDSSILPLEDEIKNNGQNQSQIEIKPKHKWQLGLQVKFGASGISDNPFQFSESARLENYYYSSPNSNAVRPMQPSLSQRSISFGLGFNLKKQLGSKTYFNTGINYHYYSNTRYVGDKINVDTALQSLYSNIIAVDNFYRNSNQKTKYTSSYHFIELPLNFEYKPFYKLPVLVNAGVNIMQMVSTNHLFYDARANVYYPYSDNVYKTQLHFSAGLSFDVLKNKKRSILIGPQLQYSATPLLKKGGDARLYFIGLNSKIDLN